jgi:uncharacterized repeat protein (TIGR02543 family)
MGGKSTYSTGTPSTRYFSFKAPSTSGTISISYSTNASQAEISIGQSGTFVASIIGGTANTTCTSSVISNLTVGTTDIYISYPSDKSYIKSITWTDSEVPSTYNQAYYTEILTTTASTAVSSGGTLTLGSSATLVAKPETAWLANFQNHVNLGSSSSDVTFTFGTPIALVSNGDDKGSIRIYYGSGSANKGVALKVNGTATDNTYNATIATRAYVAEYTIPTTTTSISSINLKANNSNVKVFAIEILTYPSATVSTVTLNTNGGTINSGDVTSYTEGVGATLPTDVTKDGFDFAGWYDNEGLTGDAVTEITTSDTGNKEFWAKWTAAATPYDITFDKGANTSATMPDALTASNVTLDEIDSDNNYRFDGWKADKDVHETTLDGTTITAGTLITAGTKVYVTQATTFTAQWTQKYAVTFNSNGGSAVETQYIASGEAAEEPTAPTRTNYTFEGWQLSGADYNFSTAVTAAITLDAVWSRNTITNNSSDVVISSGTTLNTGGILSVSASPSAGTSGGGISFAGNITGGSDKATRYIQFTVPTGATATVKTITVTSNSVIIRDDIDGINLNEHVYYKTDNTAEYNKIMPAGTYYIGRGVGSGTVMTACTLTLSSPALTVTVKTLGQDDQVIKVTSGETLGNIFLSGTLPTPVVDGYVFNGWKNADDDTDVTASTVISGSMTIYAALTPDAESVSATIPSSGWGTYCSKYNLDFSDASTEVLAYAVSAFDAESLTVTYEKQTGVVPAGTGLLLYGETGSKTIATTGEEGTAPAVNKLEGFLSATPYSADGDVRYLGMSGGSWLEMTAGTIPAGKAALKITSAEMSTVQAKVAGGAKFTIIYDDGETTGIESIHNSQFTIHTDAPMYNLSGQRVSESYKGIVIVNGRKVIRK